MIDKYNISKETKDKRFLLSNVLILFIFLIVLLTFFSLISRSFYSIYNLTSMLSDVSFIAVIASALTLNLVAGEVDISIGANIGLTSSLVALLYSKGINIWICILIGLITGLAIGIFNGFVVAYLNINSLIATLGTMSILQGISFTITDGKSILIMEDILGFIGRGKILGIPFSILLAILIYILFEIILKFTKFGRIVQVTGSSKIVAFLSGIQVKKTKFITMTLCGLMASFSGLIVTSLTAVGMPQHGMGMELIILSSVILGGTSFYGGRGSVTGTIIAVLILSVIYNGLTILNVSYFITQIVRGSLLVLIVGVYEIRESRLSVY